MSFLGELISQEVLSLALLPDLFVNLFNFIDRSRTEQHLVIDLTVKETESALVSHVYLIVVVVVVVQHHRVESLLFLVHLWRCVLGPHWPHDTVGLAASLLVISCH